MHRAGWQGGRGPVRGVIFRVKFEKNGLLDPDFRRDVRLDGQLGEDEHEAVRGVYPRKLRKTGREDTYFSTGTRMCGARHHLSSEIVFKWPVRSSFS
jgi:hypothetical protein